MPTRKHQAIAYAATELLQRAEELSREVSQLCIRTVPALAAPELRTALLTGSEANVRFTLTQLATGNPDPVTEAPPGALGLAREMVYLGADVDAVLRGYRLAHSWCMDLMVDAIEPHCRSTGQLGEETLFLSRWLFGYVEAVCAEIVAEYEAERARWLPTALARRSAAIRSVLIDPSAGTEAGTTLGYRFDGLHVGIVAWGVVAANPAALLRESLNREPGPRALVHSPSSGTVWAWIPVDRVPDWKSGPGGIRVALGTPHAGASGFARTHSEALKAQRVALLADPAPEVSRFADLEVASLLTENPAEAVDFVARELGGLAALKPSVEKLRATVLAVLDLDSMSAAAQVLDIHQNTVLQRLRRAEELRGRPIDERRLQLHNALYLARLLGNTMSPGIARR